MAYTSPWPPAVSVGGLFRSHCDSQTVRIDHGFILILVHSPVFVALSRHSLSSHERFRGIESPNDHSNRWNLHGLWDILIRVTVRMSERPEPRVRKTRRLDQAT